MDIEELKKQLTNSSTEETEDQLKRTFKVIKLLSRRLKSLEKTDYYPDEIVLGAAVALLEYLQEVDTVQSKELKEMASRLINM